MKNVAMLLARIPNPRTLRRIKVLENNFSIYLFYWDRSLEIKEEFEISNKINVKQIIVRAPQGKPLARIRPLIKFIHIALNGLKLVKPEIIHAENLDMLLIANIYKVFYDKKIKIVYEVADLPKYAFTKKVNSPKTLIFKVMQIIERLFTKNISKLILTSPYFWSRYFSNFINEDKYLFIPNAPSKLLFDRYKKKNHISFTVGFIGSVRYVEQLKVLMEAVNELGKNIRVFIAGSGPGYEEIIEFSKSMDFVDVYGPYNYEKEIVDLYERIDCTYSVYNTELENVRIALPNRLYESVVCEIPIIGAKNTVLGEFIEENQIGSTVSSNNKEELKKELLKLLESKELVNFYQENCRKIKKDYYYENNVKKLLSEYKKIL